MLVTPKELVVFRTSEGHVPFDEWLRDLNHPNAVARILARLGRVRLGNLGDCQSVGEGVSELRLNYGPGYRVYFGQQGRTVVVLLCGGSKRTQDRDIRRAKQYWSSFKQENVSDEKRDEI